MDKVQPRREPDEYDVRDAARTIHRAHAHMRDKKMMKLVHKHVQKSAKSMQAFSDALKGGGSGIGRGAPEQPGQGDQMPLEAFGP